MPAHTVLVFIPGNPGLIEWYIPMFQTLVERLGPGHCARGVANVGHSLDPERIDVGTAAAATPQTQTVNRASTCIPWTVDGQSWQKVAYMDWIMHNEFHLINNKAKFIFIGHSIGVHFTIRMLLFRPDILARTALVLGLTPFIRMNTGTPLQHVLNFAAARVEPSILAHQMVSHGLAQLPLWVTQHVLLRRVIPNDVAGREIAARLIRQPAFFRNFGLLGAEEVRDVPETIDVAALHYVGRMLVPTVLLYAGNDHWGPEFHVQELRDLQEQSLIPPKDVVLVEHKPELNHDFVNHPDQVSIVVEFCLQHINLQQASTASPRRSRL